MIKRTPIFAAAAIMLLLLSGVSFAQPQLPQPKGMLNDFAGKLSPGTQQQIETLLENFKSKSGGIEVTVVTVNFDDMQGYPIEQYALELGRQWGVGRDSDKRALLLLVAIKPPESDGKYHGGTRLEVSRHLEGEIPDALAGELIRRMRDDFMAGRFDQALSTGTQTILATLASRLGISMDGIDQTQVVRQPSRPPARSSRRGRGIPVFLIVLVVFIVFSIIRAIGGGGGRGGGRRGGIGSDWLLWAILFGSGRGGGWGGFGGDRDSSWGGGGWGGGDGGDGGGFGGFGGGGDFGGGGASDSW